MWERFSGSTGQVWQPPESRFSGAVFTGPQQSLNPPAEMAQYVRQDSQRNKITVVVTFTPRFIVLDLDGRAGFNLPYDTSSPQILLRADC